jgi:hypothetical protein
MPLPVLNSIIDPLLPPGLQFYWNCDYITELSEEALAKRR